MLKKYSIILALILLISCSDKGICQPFLKLFGDSNSTMVGYDFQTTGTGDFLMSGYISKATTDAFLIKFNPDGDTLWTKFYDSGMNDLFYVIKKLNDGNFIVGGSFDSVAALVKVDVQGNVLWSYKYSSLGFETIRDIVPMPDSGMICIADGGNFSRIFRLTKNAGLLWTKTFYGHFLNQVARLSDGTFITCGSHGGLLNSFGSNDIGLIKFTNTGTVLWQKIYGDVVYQTAKSLVIDSNDNIYITGQQKAVSNFSDIFLMKINAAGAIQWVQSYFGSSLDVVTSVNLYNNNLYLTGHSQSFLQNKFYAFLMKTNLSGSVAWTMAYGDTINNALSTFLAADSVFFLAGFTNLNVPGSGMSAKSTLIKTDLNGNTGCYGFAANFSTQSILFNDSTIATDSIVPLSIGNLSYSISGGVKVSTICPVVGIDEKNATIIIEFYPNPGHGEYHLISSMQTPAIEHFTISELNGKCIFKGSAKIAEAFRFNASPGIYIIETFLINGAVKRSRFIHL